MTNNAPRDRFDLVAVQSVAGVQGKYGPQWQIQCQWSFSRYPSKGWVSDASAESDDNRIYHPKSATQPQPSRTYPCIIRRGNLSVPKDGSVRDGTMAWMYQWKLVEFDTQKTADDYPDSDSDSEVPGAGPPQQSAVSHQPSAPAPASQPMLAGDERQRLIVQQNILNRAVDLYIGTIPWRAKTLINTDWTDAILDVANQLWAILPTIGREPPPEATEPPESAVRNTWTPSNPEGYREPVEEAVDEAEELPW